MGRNWKHDLSKIDYTDSESLKRSLKKVFPELNQEGLKQRYDIEKQYIGWEKKENSMGVKVWCAPGMNPT